MKKERGSIELITLALIAALIVVLAMPLLTGLGQNAKTSLNLVNNALMDANTKMASQLP